MSISDVRKRIAEEEKRRSTSSLANAQQNDSVHDRVAKIKSAATLYDAEDIGYGTDERISHVNKNLYQPNNQRDMRLTAQGLAHLGKRAGSVINTLGIYSDHFGEAGKIAQERAGVANSPAAKQAQAMARARSGDMNVLSGLDEDDPQYALYKRLLRLSGYDDVTRAYGATELPEELTREGVSTYADLFGRQQAYSSNQMGRDLQDVEFLSQGAGDSQRYLDASGRLAGYFGGDWSAEAVNERMQAGGADWYQDLIKQYGQETESLREAYPLDGKEHDYDAYVRHMQENAKQKQEQDAMLARYNEWKAYYDGKWGDLSSAPDYAQYTGEIVDPATLYPAQVMPDTLTAGYEYMTDEEKRNFTYLYNNPDFGLDGDDGAEQYLKDLQEELWRRRITAQNQKTAEFADRNAFTGALSWLAARGANLANDLVGGIMAIGAPTHAAFGEEISPYDPAFNPARFAQTIDTTNQQNIAEATPWANIGGRFNPFNIAYGGLSSFGDSALAGLTFGPTGGAWAQAFGAGNVELMQGLESGERSFTDVIADAFATGAFEGLTEKFSMDALFKGGTSAAKNIARSMLTEPSEEIANMLLNLGYERLRYGTDDDLGRRMSELVTQGYTESDARVQLLKELGADALETALTAMVAGGAGGGASAVSTSVENRSIGKSIQANEATSRLLEIAEGMGDFPNDVRALIEDQKAALQAAQEAQRASETQSEETVGEEPETSDAAQEVAQEEVAEEAAPKKPDTKKKKTPQLNNAKLGRIYRETMSRLDEQAQALLEGSFAETSVRKSLERFAFLDTDSKGQVVRRDKPMQQMLERAATKAIYSAERLTDQEKSVLRGSKAALRTVGEFTGIVARDGSSERERIRSAAEELYSLTQSKNKPDAENAEDAETLATAAPDDVSVTVEEAGELSPAEAAQVVEEYASGYGGNADIVTGTYEQGQNVAEFASAFRTAYEYGQDGRNLEEMKTGSALAMLNERQIRTAYELGRGVRRQFVKNAQKQYRGVPVGNVDTSALKGMKLNGTQQRSVGAIRRLAEAVGFNVEFIASAPNAEGMYTKKNGSWNHSTRTMTVDINAGRIDAGDANYAMMQTVGHELTHFISDFADSELFSDYQEFVFSHLSEKMDEDVLNDKIRKIIAGNAQQGKTLTREQAAIEVVADASGDALLSMTEADIRELAQTKPTLLQKIADYIQKWTKKVVELIRRAYDGQGRNSISEQMIDVAEEMGRKWVALLKDANARTTHTEVYEAQKAEQTQERQNQVTTLKQQDGNFLAYNHIDQRTAKTVRSVDTQLFCSEVEEATLYYAAAANMLLHDVEGSVSGQKFFTGDGEVTGQKRMTSDFIAGVKDSTGWTWDKIRNSLEQFAAMESGEQLPKNTVTNREMELYLDEVLSNGYITIDGVKVAPATDYIEAKNQYRGSASNAAPRSAYEEAVDFMEYAFGDVAYSVREGADPKTSAQAYKLFNVDENGLPHALFIDAANALELGTWYDADSPLIKDMEDLEPGTTYYIDRDGYAELRRFNNKAQSPSKSDLEEAAREGGRFIYVGVYKDAKRKGQKSYANWGLNGSGQISTFAMRPGWHMTNVPAARHIGAGRNGGEAMYRRPNQRWFLVEYATDVDYNEEAAQNPTKDIATHIPTDGWYSFRTNTNAEADQDWIISGALKIVRPVSEREAHRIAQEAGVPEDLPYKDGVKAFAEDDVQFSVRDTSDEANSIRNQIKEHMSELNAMDAVADKETSLPADYNNKTARIAWAMERLEKSGYKVEREDIGTVVFDRNRIKTAIGYIHANDNGRLAALVALPEVLRYGIHIGTHYNHKDRRYPTLTFAAPVIINGVRGNMAATVIQTNGNNFRAHRILMPDGSSFEFVEKNNAATGTSARADEMSRLNQSTDAASTVIVAQDDDSVNQLRDPDLISDREILANIMESAANNADELDHVRRYRKHISTLNRLQADLDETNAAIADARRRGATAEQAALTDKANDIARKLDREDGMLLKFESGKLLQAVVNRQRAQLRKRLNEQASRRARERMKEVRQQDREHYEERIRQLRAEKNAKLDEMRREKTDAVAKVRAEKNESFAKAQYRAEVQKRAKRLMDMLTTPTNKAYVPEFLRRPLADFITALDFSSVTKLEGGSDTKGDERLKDAMSALATALRRVHNQQFGDQTTGAELFSGYLDLPGDFLDTFDELMAKIRVSLSTSPAFAATPVNRMTSEQLHDLAKVFRLLHSSISNMNRLIANAKYASAVNAANDTMAELDGLRAKNDQNALLDRVSSFLDWKNTVPYYVFQRFGKGGKAIFEGLMDGWDQLARNSDELVKFANSAYETKEVREWDRQIQTVKLDSGTEIRTTTAQMMSVYCLAKREQARGHLLGGGIRVADITGRGGRLIRQADNHLLTDDDIKRIAGMLTERQREVADKLQKHMSTRGSEWGNYVSMKRFGYEMFTEANYFPIETDPNNRKAQDEKSEGESLYRLLNMSATKSLVRNANNAIVIRGIFDVYTAHMSDMAKYNALGLQLLDTFKWFNYVERTQNKDGTVETRSVQKSLEAAYGGDARSYILQLLRDLNGTNEGGREDGVIKRAISNYKIASVAANLRVGILQITSLPRAAYAIDPKYLAIGITKWNTGKGKNSRRAYDEVGIAKWKELGFYDTNISRSIRQRVKHDETIVDVVRDKSMKLAEWGDAWTLGVLYGAVEAEMKDRYPSTKPGTDAYKTLLNRRMREIIYQTQVVDSTMTRSQLMRSKGLITIATSFMSEPTLAMNMLNDAIFEARMKARSGAKDWLPAAMPKVAKAFGTTAFVIGMSSLVEALMTAYRDDDEFEKFSEKMRKAFFGENFWDGSLGGNLNLMNNLPVIKDIVSAAQGNSTDAMYNAWVKTLGDGVQTLYKVILDGGSSADIYRGVYKTVNGLSQFTGIAAGAAMREFVAAYNTFGADRITRKRLQTYDNTAKDAARAIYAASMRDDTDMVKFYRERAAMYGIDESKISKALATLIEEELKAGNIDSATASKLLTGEAGKSADYTSDLINDAQYELDTGLDFDNLRDDYAAGVLSESQVRNYLVKYGGKSTEEIEDTMSRYDYYIATGKTTTPPKYWRIAYAHETGGNYRRLAEDAMVSIIAGGRTEKQARRQIADSLESYYKDEYLSIAGTPAGDRMLEDILDVYEAIGFTREYERNYINENWFD